MELFEIKDHEVTFAPQALELKPFAKLWKNDKSKKKEVAIAELAAVYYYADYKSDFSELVDEKERLDSVRQIVVGLPEDWEPSLDFMRAVDFYKERQDTVATILLRDARIAVDKISKFLRNVDLMTVDDKGKPIHDAKKINDTIASLSKTVESLDKLEKEVKKNLQAKNSMRGAKEASLMEDGA